jgi:hypothetical protein
MAFSSEFISTGGDTRDSRSMALTFLKYSCDRGWMTKAKRFTRCSPGYRMRGAIFRSLTMPSVSSSRISSGALPVAARIIASSISGPSTWPSRTGDPSTTMATPIVLEARQAFVVDVGRDDGLAGQFLQAEVVQIVHRRHHHRGLGHRPAQHVARPAPLQSLGHHLGRLPARHVVCAAGVQAQRFQAGQQLGHTQLQQRVGKVRLGVYSRIAIASLWCVRPLKNSTRALSK